MEGIDYQHMGRQIKRLRQAEGMTQEELSKLARVSASFIGHIERGTRKTGIETLIRICRGLKVPLEWVLLPHDLNLETEEDNEPMEMLQQAFCLILAACQMCRENGLLKGSLRTPPP